MNRRVLLVDDEPNVLEGIKRLIRKSFEVSTAAGAQNALEIMRAEPEFAVIVSDMRMPQMSGLELLSAARTLCPDTVRIMLTGNSDQKTAVDAVNCGEVFKFLNKPCEVETLTQALEQAIRQYQLVTAEHELLNSTLHGSIKALVAALSIAKPEAFGRNERICRKAQEICEGLPGIVAWEMQAAAQLSHLGCISLPKSLLDKVAKGDVLTSKERNDYERHPELGAELLANVPRMEGVAASILYQHKNFDGSGFPYDGPCGDAIPLGARVLRLALAHDECQALGWPEAIIGQDLRSRNGCFDPKLLDRLGRAEPPAAVKPLRVAPDKLRVGQTITEDVQNDQGILLICRGQIVTPAIQRHLRHFHSLGTLSAPIWVAATQLQARGDRDEA